MLATLLPDRERRLAYLRGLAAIDWGKPSGFGGRTLFQAIPALELERQGAPTPALDWRWIEYSLELIRKRKDCQDFAMVGLLRILLRYPFSRLLDQDLRDEAVQVLLRAKFAEHDPGADGCCWLTENHQIQYLSSEYLAGRAFAEEFFTNTGQTGAWHADRARPALLRWLLWRMRFSFSEWNSACYLDEDAAALLNLVEFSDDGEIRRLAREVIDMLLFHVALNSLDGVPGGSRGRAYLEDQLRPGESPVAILAQLAWTTKVPTRLGLAAVLLAAGDYSLDPAVVAVGSDRTLTFENRERHGLDVEEAGEFGVALESLEDYPFFCGAGLSEHPSLQEIRFHYHQGVEKWPGFYRVREYVGRCRAQGRAPDSRAIPYALSRAEICTFRTPDYLLGCAQAYRPGAPGYQQFVWSATLPDQVVVFTGNPAPPDVPYGRPGPWVGQGVLPKALQHRNVLFALHRVRPCPIGDDPPWFREDRVHAFFPRGLMDEVVDMNGWCLARKGSAYIALRAMGEARWLPPEKNIADLLQTAEPYEWNVDALDVAWVCELGAANTHGHFTDFVERITAAVVEGDITHIRFESPTLGVMETGWERGLEVNGRAVPVSDYPRFANPFCNAPFGTRSLEIRCQGHVRVLAA